MECEEFILPDWSPPDDPARILADVGRRNPIYQILKTRKTDFKKFNNPTVLFAAGDRISFTASAISWARSIFNYWSAKFSSRSEASSMLKITLVKSMMSINQELDISTHFQIVCSQRSSEAHLQTLHIKHRISDRIYPIFTPSSESQDPVKRRCRDLHQPAQPNRLYIGTGKSFSQGVPAHPENLSFSGAENLPTASCERISLQG